MKIRTDFVTNSSSSSFTVCVCVETKDGKSFSYDQDDEVFDMNGNGDVSFNADLQDLITNKSKKLKAKYSDVEKLARFLMDAVQGAEADDDYDDYYDDEEDDYGDDEEDECDEAEADAYDESDEDTEIDAEYGVEFDEYVNIIKHNKEVFVRALKRNVKPEEISSITVSRRYDAWGEFADLVADNDEELCSLAKKVVETEGDAKETALKEFFEYINTPHEFRSNMFGCGCNSLVYCGYKDYNRETLIKLATALADSDILSSSVSGEEEFKLNLETGEYDSVAYFDL